MTGSCRSVAASRFPWERSGPPPHRRSGRAPAPHRSGARPWSHPSRRPVSVSSVQLPWPGSSTMAWPPCRNIAVSKLARVRRLGSMKTMARTFRSRPPGHLAPLDPRGECEERRRSPPAPILGREEVALSHASTSFSAPSRRSASAGEKKSGGSRRSTCGISCGAGQDPVRKKRLSVPRRPAASRSPSSRPRPCTRYTPIASAPARIGSRRSRWRWPSAPPAR